MKTTFQNFEPKITYYKNYKTYSKDKFREKLLSKLSMEDISNTAEKNTLEYLLRHTRKEVICEIDF